jgi:hypothetical protein
MATAYRKSRTKKEHLLRGEKIHDPCHIPARSLVMSA